MSEIQKCNISLLKNYKQKFDSEKRSFLNNSYNNFSSSYISYCSDSTVGSMRINLNKLYKSISNYYTNIDKWWTDYNENIEGLEKYMAGNGSSGGIPNSSIRSYISSRMRYLDDKTKVDKIKFSNINNSKKITFRSNSVSNFSSLFKDYYKKTENVVNPKSQINEVARDTGALVTTIPTKALYQDTILNDGVTKAREKLNSWWENNAVPFFSDAISTLGNVLKKTGATIVTAFTSLVEGVFHFGEAVVDLVAILGTSAATVATATVDAGKFIYGKIVGKEYDSVTKKMWNNTKAYVSKQHVTSWFDSFYEDAGKILKDNAIGFDTVRSIFDGVGYIAGTVVLTIATAGLGGAITASGSAAGSVGATAATASKMSIVYGISSTGKNTEKAWGEDVSTVKGLIYGTVSGAWDGLQFFIGSKIGAVDGLGTKIANKIVGTEGIVNKIVTSVSRVILDGIDSGLEGFVQPMLQNIYKDQSYIETFEENGGWKYVATNAAIGSIASTFGEVLDLSSGTIGKATNSVKTHISNLFDKTKAKVVDIYDSAFSFASNIVDDVVTGVKEIVDNFSSKVSNYDTAYDGDLAKFDNIKDPVIKNISDEEIISANMWNKKGLFYKFDFEGPENLPDINDRFWTSIENRNLVFLNIGDRQMTMEDAISYKMNYDLIMRNYDVDSNQNIKIELDDTTVELDDKIVELDDKTVELDNNNITWNIKNLLDNTKTKIANVYGIVSLLAHNFVDDITTGSKTIAKKFSSQISNYKNLFVNIDKNTTIDLNRVENLDQIAKNNEISMKVEILNSVVGLNDPVTKIRKLYMELNSRLHYDLRYYVSDDLTKKSILEEVSFENLNGKNVVCKGWSELFYELLIDSGFDEKDVLIVGNNHKWIEVNLGDEVLIADATEAIGKSIDFSNCKSGLPTEGFYVLPKIYSGSRLSALIKQNQIHFIDIENNQKILNKIDLVLGYKGENGYFNDILQKTKQLFGDSDLSNKLLGDEILEINFKKLIDMDIPKNMDGYECFAYFKNLNSKIFTEEQNKNIFLRFLYSVTPDNKIEPITVMRIIDDTSAKVFVYSETTGKIIFDNYEQYCLYEKGLNLTSPKK